jgi:hypothetical protein
LGLSNGIKVNVLLIYNVVAKCNIECALWLQTIEGLKECVKLQHEIKTKC